MRYCEKCGLVIDEFSPDRNKQNCPICSGVWSEDDMTALKYAELSESEKDSYDEQLYNSIISSSNFDRNMHYQCGLSVEDGGFWSWFRPEKLSLDPNFPKEDIENEIKKRKNEPFKPFPPIDTVKAREVAKDAEIAHKAVERGYYSQSNTQQENTPKCPTCQSTNLRKISTTSKAINTVAFGLLGTKRNKTFHCNNCGYEW